MTTVRMLVSISGTRGGEDWPPRGGTLSVPSSEATDLVLAGLAVLVPDEPETAAVEPVEQAVVRRGRPRKMN